MATTIQPTIATIRASLVEVLKAVPGIPNVHDRPRWTTRPDGFIALMWDPAGNRVHSWHMDYLGGRGGEADHRYRWPEVTRWAVRGLYSFNDAENTQAEWDKLTTAVRQAFQAAADVFTGEALPETTSRGIVEWTVGIGFAVGPLQGEMLLHTFDAAIEIAQTREVDVP